MSDNTQEMQQLQQEIQRLNSALTTAKNQGFEMLVGERDRLNRAESQVSALSGVLLNIQQTLGIQERDVQIQKIFSKINQLTEKTQEPKEEPAVE